MKEVKEEKIKFAGSILPEKTKDLGHGVVEVIVSTGATDRHGEKINPEGIITKHYNGIVLYGHDYEGLPIGKALSLRRKAGELRSKVQFAVEEYPFAKTVYKLIKGGFLKDVSIGGVVNKWNEAGDTVDEMEMMEFSIVPIGANRDAKIVAAGIGKSIDTIKDEYYEALQKFVSLRVKEMPDRDLRETVEVMEKLLAALKGEVDKPEGDAVNSAVKRVRFITMQQHAKGIDHEAEKLLNTIKVKLKKE